MEVKNKMETSLKKSLKLVVLLISSIIISTASATVYNQLFQSATITVSSYALQWISGTDSVSFSGEGTAYCSISLSAPEDGGRNYTDPVRLNNTENVQHTFNLTVDSVSGDTPHLEYIYIRLYDSSGTYKGTFAVWSNGAQNTQSSGPYVIEANDYWIFEWDIKWNSASTSTSSVSVTLRVDVTG